MSTITEQEIQKLLDRSISIYEKGFLEKPIGKDYFEKRKITDAGLFSKYRIGICNGKLKTILPENGEIRIQLKEIGILMNNDYERFTDCVVVPIFDLNGDIVSLYGRSIKTSKHMFLPGRPKGIWNIGIIKSCPEIILVESISDALSVMMAGFHNVIAIQGTNGLSDDDILLFKEHGVQKITLLLDGDDPGKKATTRLKETMDIPCEIKTLPDDHDPNSFLAEHGAEKLAEFISQSVESTIKQPNQIKEINPQNHIVAVDDGFVIIYGVRKYLVFGLEKTSRKLKAIIRVEHAGKLVIENVEFYSSRSRNTLSQSLCRIFDETPETIESDIFRLIHDCEKLAKDPGKKDEKGTKSKTYEMTAKEKEEAIAFGKSPDLIQQILSDYEKCGLIGEDANKLLIYIAMCTRKRNKPIAILIIASSGSGKSTLQDAVVMYCPPEDVVQRTVLSGKALFYKEQASIKHKVLALEEGEGASEAAYAIRSLISSGYLTVETTIKDMTTGKLTTMENKVEGPTAVFYTTANPNIHPETKSRFIVTGMDESREQTRSIQAFQRNNEMEDDIIENIEIDAILRKHWNFQRLLKPIAVKNPYGSHLTYGDDRLQGRRDQPKYLALIKGVAFMRQMQKEIKYDYKKNQKIPYIEVDFEDIRIANILADEILGRSLDELSRPARDLLLLLDEMVTHFYKELVKKSKSINLKKTEIKFTRRDIRDYTGWSNYRVHTHLKELVDFEYVVADSGKNGSQYSYRLPYEGQGKNGERFVMGLKHVDELKKELNLSGAFG